MAHPLHASSSGLPVDLRARAREIVTENGFVADFSPDVDAEVAALANPNGPEALAPDVRDLRSMLWSSIDNRESRDLDQIEFCEQLDGGLTRLRLGVADVDR